LDHRHRADLNFGVFVGPVSRWAVNKPKSAILAWVILAFIIIGFAGAFGGTYNNSFSLPDTESTTAQNLMNKIPGAKQMLTAPMAKIVWSPATGSATSPAVATKVTQTLTTISQVPGVACVYTPYGTPLGTQCQTIPAAGSQGGGSSTAGMSPETIKVLAGMARSGFSVDQTVGYSTVIFKGSLTSLSKADAAAVLEAVKALNGQNGLLVGANGQALSLAATDPPKGEVIGIIVALIILLITFGSLIGAILPIGSAILSLGVGQALVLITARFLDVATFAPTLAAMIGLGVGIDYALFVINRYKQALDAGREPRAAALESVRTSGRAVVFAAATVVIALLGLFVLRINFFNGLAVAAAATVILMMVGATLLLPAVLSLLGRKAFAVKMPWARKPKEHRPDGGAFAKYGRWLEHNFKWFGALAFMLLIVIAIPLGSLRLGFADDSSQAKGKPSRIAYDLLSSGFGPGINGPFIVAVKTKTPGDTASVLKLAGVIQSDKGVAAVVPFPMAPNSNISAIQVVPTTEPQDQATTDLLHRLRGKDIRAVTAGGAITAYVGGTQAITSDFTTVLGNALPLFLLVVIGLGFLALVLLFRSIVVPLTGAMTSLLSLAAAMGVTVAVFQWGWLKGVIGLSGTGPIMPFLPIMVFAILFGLSMDYQVFLVSRMQEEWSHTHNNSKAVRRGLASSGRVVAIAAAIMFSVFAAFVLGNDPTIKLFGLALSTAVLFDAFIVRLIIVPSIMYQFGKANWWLPGWLERILPKVAVESEEDIAIAEAEIGSIDDLDDEVVAAK
jgi:RND superfamily putative drug exporter